MELYNQDSNNPLADAPSAQEAIYEATNQEAARWRELAKACELDPAKDYGTPQYLLTQNGIGFSPLGDIQMLKAPQKNGKTFLFSLMMGAILNGEYLGLKCEVPDATILYVDTEQHPRNTQLVYRRACKIGCIPGRERNDRIHAYHMRGKSPEEILGTTVQLIEDLEPTVVFIDGIRDFVHDFNDQQESADVVRLLMDIAMRKNCSIWSVLHVNPGTDKAKGHLGTEMQTKVSDVLCCLKEKRPEDTIFTVDQTDARNRDIQQFSFVIQDVQDGDGFLAIPTHTHISVKEKTTADETVARALNDGPKRYSDLRDKIIEIEKCSKATACRRIASALEAHIIEQDSVMKKFRYIGLDLSNEDDCPF